MPFKEQERWIVEQNIARFEVQLKITADEKQRDQLRGLLTREKGQLRRLPPA